jgi:hypothetical protein
LALRLSFPPCCPLHRVFVARGHDAYVAASCAPPKIAMFAYMDVLSMTLRMLGDCTGLSRFLSAPQSARLPKPA